MTKAQLAESFTDKVLIDYYQWRLTLPKGSRRGIRYKGMITRFGAAGTIKRLLASRTNKRRALEFGAEQWVLNPRFRSLFSAAQIKEATDRLKESE